MLYLCPTGAADPSNSPMTVKLGCPQMDGAPTSLVDPLSLSSLPLPVQATPKSLSLPPI